MLFVRGLIKFKADGPFQKHWIYGHYLDEDNLVRNVACRKGRKWVPLPFTAGYSSFTSDIAQNGDTMYITGFFRDLILDKDSSALPVTSLIKYYNDSIWANEPFIYIDNMSVSGDSLLAWGTFLKNGDTIHGHILSPDAGHTWRYPYS